MNNIIKAEQFIAAHKANLETVAGMSNTIFGGVERLVELNMAATKAAMGEAFANAKGLINVKTPQELFATQAALVQPAFEKSVSYSRHVYDIVASVAGELSKTAEAKMAEGQAAVESMVEGNLKNAPAGSEAAVAAFKAIYQASQNASSSLKKAAKQAAETAESNMKAASAQAETLVKSALKAK